LLSKDTEIFIDKNIIDDSQGHKNNNPDLIKDDEHFDAKIEKRKNSDPSIEEEIKN
jgi:hypothetical protein